MSQRRAGFKKGIILVTAFLFSLSSYMDVSAFTDEKKLIQIDTTREWVDASNVVLDLQKLHFDYSDVYGDNEFSRLNRIIKQSMGSSREDFQLQFVNFSEENFNKLSDAIEELCFYNGYSIKRFRLDYKKDPSEVIYRSKIHLETRESREERKKVERWVNEQVKKHVAPLKNDVDKIKRINKIIAENIKYDDNLSNFTAYEGVFKGATVCDGYSVLGHRMLSAAGFKDILTVKGFSTQSGKNVPHRWNMIRLGDKWYHIDFTFNDTGHYPKSEKYLNDYLLKSDQYMRKDHKWDETKYPSAY